MMIFEWRKKFGFFEGGGVAAAGWYKLLFFNDARWEGREEKVIERKIEEREKDRGKKEGGKEKKQCLFLHFHSSHHLHSKFLFRSMRRFVREET